MIFRLVFFDSSFISAGDVVSPLHGTINFLPSSFLTCTNVKVFLIGFGTGASGLCNMATILSDLIIPIEILAKSLYNLLGVQKLNTIGLLYTLFFNKMDFWRAFKTLERQIAHSLRLNTAADDIDAINGIEAAGRISGYPLSWQIGKSIRNGRNLPERLDSFELIISPNWRKSNVEMVDRVYSSWMAEEVDIPPYWNVVKYQPFLPTSVHGLSIDGIVHDDFSYCAQINFDGGDVWIGLIVFVANRIAPTALIKSARSDVNPETTPEWTLNASEKNGQAVLTFLNAAIGEYNMITLLKAVEFHPESSYPMIPRHSLDELHGEFIKIYRQNHADPVRECTRCGYYSYQAHLTKCSRPDCAIYYCDSVCKLADSKNHAYVCRPDQAD